MRDQLDADFESVQAKIEAEALAMDEAKAKRHLTDYGCRAAGLMMDRWRQLFERVIVKYNDMAIKPEADGKFKKTAGGDHVPLIRTGYPERYRKAIVDATGDRYLAPTK